MKKHIKIATYNICHCLNFVNYVPPEPAWKVLEIEPEKTAETIRSLGAEIVGLNEVYETGGGGLDEQAKTLARYAGFKNHAFGEAICFGGEKRYGNAMLLNDPLLSADVIKVPAPPQEQRTEGGYYEDRAILRVVTEIGGVKVTVMSTHFGLNPSEQKNMVEKLAEILDETKTPVILMGDFNAQPHEKVLQPIYSRLKSAADESNCREFTFASYAPERVIDYIFVSREFCVESVEAVDARTSDHRPLTATLSIETK